MIDEYWAADAAQKEARAWEESGEAWELEGSDGPVDAASKALRLAGEALETLSYGHSVAEARRALDVARAASDAADAASLLSEAVPEDKAAIDADHSAWQAFGCSLDELAVLMERVLGPRPPIAPPVRTPNAERPHLHLCRSPDIRTYSAVIELATVGQGSAVHAACQFREAAVEKPGQKLTARMDRQGAAEHASAHITLCGKRYSNLRDGSAVEVTCGNCRRSISWMSQQADLL